jgi:hypothetical protein
MIEDAMIINDVTTRIFHTGPRGVEDNMVKVVLISIPSSEDKLSACSKNKEVAESSTAIPHDSSMRRNRLRGRR